MATVLRSSVFPILQGILQYLSDSGVWQDRIFIQDPLEPCDVQAEQIILIWPEGFTDQVNDFGSGRVDTRISQGIGFTLRTRLGTDQTGSSFDWLQQHAAFELRVMNLLHVLFVTDSSLNNLLYEPARFRGSSGYHKNRQQPDWGESVLRYEVGYELDLDQTISPLG